MATTQNILNSRLMKAADALIRQGEFVKCEMVRGDETTECQLVGRMGNGAQLRRWFDGQIGQSPVPFEAVLIDDVTAARLEAVATEQAAPIRGAERWAAGQVERTIPIRGTWRRAGKVARNSWDARMEAATR